MSVRKKKLTEKDRMKYEIAKELGLMDKVDQLGWGSLTAKETGRIGGIMTARAKKPKNKENKKNK